MTGTLSFNHNWRVTAGFDSVSYRTRLQPFDALQAEAFHNVAHIMKGRVIQMVDTQSGEDFLAFRVLCDKRSSVAAYIISVTPVSFI